MMDKKIYIALCVSILLVGVGVSLAYFGIKIIGNDTAKGNKVVTGNLELTFTDTNEITLNDAFPGDSFTKTISVKNTGTKEVNYSLVWTELTNEITKDELVIEATCKRLNSSGTEEGTCESISQTPIKSMKIKKNISIEPNITHEYTIKVTFIDTGIVQNYNKNKSFSGKLGINEYNLPTSVSFAEDSWETIAELVKAGKTDTYNVGDTKTVDMGTYGTHTLRIANMSTPSECSTTGFSQTACGFVLEFADIITTHNMNPSGTYKGTTYNNGWNVDGWPASSMYTFVNNDIYNAIPSELRNVIIDTVTVSGHGSKDTENFISTDKLYLLSTAEVWAQGSSNTMDYDTARDNTRQLDYYKNLNTNTVNYSPAIKNNGSSAYYWWLRAAFSSNYNYFLNVYSNGDWRGSVANFTPGVSPAFRIG